MAKILIVEDDSKIARFVELELRHEGYETETATDGRTGLSKALEPQTDLVLLDIMLPELSGMEVCRRIRQESQVPVIMLTAKGEEVDKLLGFALGVCSGFTIPISQSFGAGDMNAVRRRCGQAIWLCLATTALITALTYFTTGPILRLTNTPENLYDDAYTYIFIIFMGTGALVLYNMAASVLRALGDSRTPLYFLIVATVLNIGLDILFMGPCQMGVAGAALATVISQGVSAVWVLRFLFSDRPPISLDRSCIRADRRTTGQIVKLGTANFIMQGTNFLVQVACNTTLQRFGGDLYVGVMTVTNSVREIFMLPVSGIINGAQPVISFNYGARAYDRVRSGIRFNTWVGSVYTVIAWGIIVLLPEFFFGIFNDDPAMLAAGVPMLKLYFFGFVFMAFQLAGQTTFQALGDAKHAIFFSLLRKAFIVVPLTLLLPQLGFGVTGVFLAEPISNVIGGLACYSTMRLTVYRRLGRE